MIPLPSGWCLDGIQFFWSENGVLLTPGDAAGMLAPRYFSRAQRLKPSRESLSQPAQSVTDNIRFVSFPCTIIMQKCKTSSNLTIFLCMHLILYSADWWLLDFKKSLSNNAFFLSACEIELH